jgi:hypothetical protein
MDIHVDIHVVIRVKNMYVWIRQWLSITDNYGYPMVIHLV